MLGASAIGLCLHERMSAAAVQQWRLRLLLSLFTIAFSIAAAEPATRWIFRHVTTSSDNGGYFSRRWYRTGAVKTNNQGFRERDFAVAKSPGTYRIAVVGDSFTFGNGVRQHDRYSDLLQAELPAKFEVLNFGVAGANTPEHLTSIQRIAPQFHPDFVLLQWYVNDVEDDDSTGRPASMPLVPFRGLLRALIEYCQKQGVPIGIVLFPDTAGDSELTMRLDICTTACSKPVARKALRAWTCGQISQELKHKQSLWANKLDHHPSARANAIAAERILETYSGVWAASPSR